VLVAMSEKKHRPYTPTEVAIAGPLIRAMSAANTWVYRLSGGRIGGRFRYGAPVLLLTTTGRKSGRQRTAPLLYLEDGERVVIVASKGGMPRHPVWYLNLAANPEVEIQIGSERRKMLARTASAEEKTALWPDLTAMYRDYDDYQARTERDIPVVILTPR
jgi:deazaflavin-dependent oxidoreductase (nitroreductase family)